MEEKQGRPRLRTAAAACFVAVSFGGAIAAGPSALRSCEGSSFTSTFDGNLGFHDYRREVFLRRNDGSVAPVTSGGLSSEPAISGDARTLVYLRALPEMSGDAPASADELVVRTIAGSDKQTRLLARASFLHDPDLSPDGRYVAVAASMEPKPPVGLRPPLLRYPAGEARDGRALVRVTDQPPPDRVYVLDTTTAAVVATIPAPREAIRETQHHPAFSPDGKQLAYQSDVATVDDASVPSSRTVRVARLGALAPGRPILTLGTSTVPDYLEWAADSGSVSITTPSDDYRSDDPAHEVPVSGAANFDIARCALPAG